MILVRIFYNNHTTIIILLLCLMSFNPICTIFCIHTRAFAKRMCSLYDLIATHMAIPLRRCCCCIVSSFRASGARFLTRQRVANYYVKPKEKKGPSGQAWALLAGVTTSIAGISIYALGKTCQFNRCLVVDLGGVGFYR